MEQTECSETSAYKIQTPGNCPEGNIQHIRHSFWDKINGFFYRLKHSDQLHRLDVWLYRVFQKKALQILKVYRNLYRGHTQTFELSKCSKTHRVLPRIVIRNRFKLFFRFILHGTSTVTVQRPGKLVLRYSRTSPR
jgi:hypothetical protein